MDNSDLPALAIFFDGKIEDGLGPDGLPVFKDVLMIKVSRPPYMSIDRIADDSDINYFEEQYRVYSKQAKAKYATAEGYPLSMWPACSQSELEMLSVREIFTVQELAKLAQRKEAVIPPLRPVAERALRFIKLSKDQGAIEAQIEELRAQNEAMKEQIKESNEENARLKATLEALRARA